MIKVHYFQRKRRANQNFSLEYIFEDLRNRSDKSKYNSKVFISKYLSNGLLPRLYNLVESIFRQGNINHVTGDINYIAIGLKKKKTILTILDCRYFDEAKGLKKEIFRWFWMELPARRSAFVTVISESTKQVLLANTSASEDKIIVIPVAVSQDFKRVDKEFNAIKPRILHVGTAPNKNLSRLIEAIKGINCTLDIVGRLSKDDELALQQREIEYTNSFSIPQEEIIKKYVECDILAFVSTYEGFGMPIVEANITGRPVITGNNTSMPEVAGDAACIVDAFSISSIRSGLLKIIQNTEYRESLVQNGFKNAKRFDADGIAKQYMNVYERIISS